MRGLGRDDDWNYDERAAIDSCRLLVESPPVRPTPTQERVVRRCVSRARQLGLYLPDRLCFLWRAGAPYSPDGVTQTEDEEIVVYLRADLQGEDLASVTYHELRHTEQRFAGYSRSMSYQQAERDADAFSKYAVQMEGELGGSFRRSGATRT